MDHETTPDDRLWAMLSYLLTLVLPIIAPFAIYVAKKDDSRFAVYHALQNLFLAIAWIILTVASLVTGVLLLLVVPYAGEVMGFLLIRIAPYLMVVAFFLCTLVGAIKAYNGEWFALPLVGAMALRQAGAGTMPADLAPAPAPPADEVGDEDV